MIMWKKLQSARRFLLKMESDVSQAVNLLEHIDRKLKEEITS